MKSIIRIKLNDYLKIHAAGSKIEENAQNNFEIGTKGLSQFSNKEENIAET